MARIQSKARGPSVDFGAAAPVGLNYRDGDEWFVTSDGTPTGTILEQYIFDEDIPGWVNVTVAAPAAACPAPMTRAALIALRNGSGLSKDCHYVITDYTRPTTVGDAQILLHAVDVNVLSESVHIDTELDNTAWRGIYDIDTNRILQMTDNVENIVIGEDTVDAFPWGDALVNRNYVSESTINYVSGAMVRNRIEAGANVTLDGTSFTDNHVFGTCTVTTADTTAVTDNEIRGEAIVNLSGAASFNRNTVTDAANVTMIGGASNENTFEGDVTYNQVANGGTVNNSRIFGTATVTSAVALNLCSIFSTSLDSTGSTGLIQGANFERSAIQLQNVVEAVDIDDSIFQDTNFNANNAQQVFVRGCVFESEADIDIGDAAEGVLVEVEVRTQGVLNVIQGRAIVNGSTIESEAVVTFNSTAVIPLANTVADSTIRNNASLQFTGDATTCLVDTSIIENTADVRFIAGAINADILSSTIQEAQYFSEGSGDFRHGLISGAVAWRNFNVLCTNVISHIATVTLTGAVGSMGSCHFSRAIINLTNVPDVNITELDMASNATLVAADAAEVLINESQIDTSAAIDAEAGTELVMQRSKLSNDSLLNLDNGRFLINESTLAEQSTVTINNAGQNTVEQLRILSGSSVILNGTGFVLTNTTVKGGSSITCIAGSLNGTILNTTVDGSSTVIYENGSDNNDVQHCQIVNNGGVRFQAAALNATVVNCTVDRYTYNANGSGNMIDSQLFGFNILNNEEVAIDSLHAFRTPISLQGAVGTITFATFMRGSVDFRNVLDLDVDNLHIDSLATVNCVGAARTDLTSCSLSSGSVIDQEAGTILDMDNVSMSDAAFVNVDAGHLRVVRTSMRTGTITNTSPNADQNAVADTTIDGSASVSFVNTVNDCTVDFCTLAGNTATNFRGATDGARITRLTHLGRRLVADEVQIEDSDNALIESTLVSSSSIEIDNSPSARITDCTVLGRGRISIRDNTAAVSAFRCTAENISTINLINTAVVAGLVNCKFLNEFTVNFDFTVAGNKEWMFGNGPATVTQTDPANGTSAQNF